MSRLLAATTREDGKDYRQHSLSLEIKRISGIEAINFGANKPLSRINSGPKDRDRT